jgi:hypothetical protein
MIDIKMHLHHTTDKAIRVSEDGNYKKAIWLPLSQVEVRYISKDTVVVTCPSWLAMEKGLT